jgi:hypothetical protein
MPTASDLIAAALGAIDAEHAAQPHDGNVHARLRLTQAATHLAERDRDLGARPAAIEKKPRR